MEPAEYEVMDRVEARMWWYRGAHANVVDLVEAHCAALRHAAVLDAGCGTGGLLLRLGERLEHATRFGIEIDPAAARRASAKSAALVVAGSVNAMPFRDGAFDAITSVDVLCHAAVDERAALAELHRCLAPGGLLVLSLPAYPWLRSAHDARVHNARRYTRGAAAALLHEAGFAVARIGYWNGLLLPLMVLRRKVLRGHADAASDVEEYPPWIDRTFGGVLAAERKLRAIGIWLPFGGSVLAMAEKRA